MRRDLLGNPWTAPFRVGLLSLLNPLNLFRIVNLLQGLSVAAESKQNLSSAPYFANNFLGQGDFTDLALINKMRFDAMGQGNEYQGTTITVPTELMEKDSEQLTMTFQKVIRDAIRQITELGKGDEAWLGT